MAGTDFMCFVFNIIYVCNAAQTVYFASRVRRCLAVMFYRRVRTYLVYASVFYGVIMFSGLSVISCLCLCYVRVLYSDIWVHQIASCVVIGSFLVVSFIVYELVSLAGICQTYCSRC